MPRRSSDVTKGLQNKGFKKSEGDHHYFHYYTLEGKKSAIFTKTSHSHNEIADGLLAMMARQCRVSGGDFKLLVDCPLSQVAYEQLLLQGGHIELPVVVNKKTG